MKAHATGHRMAVVFLLVGGALGLARCGADAESCEGRDSRLAPVQPNRSSALAEAMRQLDAELVEYRDVLLSDAPSLDGAAFTVYDLNDLEPTDSSMFVEGYTAFAMAFHQRIADFNASPGADTYVGVVNGCTSCHQKACPGPLERIAKRELP